jgi:hypothetical protein
MKKRISFKKILEKRRKQSKDEEDEMEEEIQDTEPTQEIGSDGPGLYLVK